jgi:hypothetical protein
VALLVFKTSVGLNKVPGGFDSHPPPPNLPGIPKARRLTWPLRNMLKRVTQPPINPLLRDPERHDFWPGFILSIIAVVLLFSGGRHLTNVETTDGNTALEVQLIKSFTSGGLKVLDPVAVSDPASFEDPAAAAAALDRMAREEARVFRIKYRVNTGAAAPCPT